MPKKKAKVKVRKIQTVAPETHIVELQVEGVGAPDIPPVQDRKTWLEWLGDLLK